MYHSTRKTGIGPHSRGPDAVVVEEIGFSADDPLYCRNQIMKLVVFVLNREELLDRVLQAYVEAGITGATILDSEGMGRFLTYEVPLFADFREFMKGNKPYNRTIFSVVRDESCIDELERLLDAICGGLSSPGTGIFFTVPVDHAKGLVDEQGERNG
jgi:nitrogen regulatory protein P-II 1